MKNKEEQIKNKTEKEYQEELNKKILEISELKNKLSIQETNNKLDLQTK